VEVPRSDGHRSEAAGAAKGTADHGERIGVVILTTVAGRRATKRSSTVATHPTHPASVVLVRGVAPNPQQSNETSLQLTTERAASR
jgi:hypothetical protein